MRNGYQPETKQQEDAYLKIQTALIPNKSNVVQLSFCSMDWGTFMRNGNQSKTKQEEDAFLKKNQITLIPKKVKCSAGKLF